jgi:aryl carrier-like protein
MTVSFKVDRKILRAIGEKLSSYQLSLLRSVTVIKRPPGTENERNLQQIWSPILKIAAEEVGIDDNFFELGGDSIAAMKLVAQASKSGLPLTAAAIFKYPSLSELARHTCVLEEGVPEYEPFILLRSNPQLREMAIDEIADQCATTGGSIVDAYPCTPLQEGLMALSMKRQGNYMVQRVIGIGHRSDTGLADTLRIWQSAIESSPIMRTRIVHASTYGMLQVVMNDSPGWLYGPNLDSYLGEDRSKEMGFGMPLMRHAVLSGSDGRKYLVFTMHHAVYDAWSWSLFKKRIDQSRAGLVVKRPTDYGSFVKLTLNPSLVEASENFWRSELGGFQGATYPPLPFSSYEPVPETQLEHRIKLSTQVHHSITTPNMIRAAWSILVKEMSSHDDCDVVFGTTLMGRNVPLPGVENIEEPTVTTIPIRTCVNPKMLVLEFLESAQEQATRTIPHEHL